MVQTYHQMLGVAVDEGSHGVRTAFRTLAPHYHPERLGVSRTPHFADLLEAFAALGGATAAEVPGARPYQEPPPADRAFRIPEDLADLSSRAAEILDWLRRNFDDREPLKSGRLQTIHVDLRLDENAAASGVRTVWGLPVVFPCSACQGSGSIFDLACRACDGRGMIEEQRWVALELEPGLPDRTTRRVALEPLGIVNTALEVRSLRRW